MFVPKSYHVRSIPVAIEANKERVWNDFEYAFFTTPSNPRPGWGEMTLRGTISALLADF